MPVLYNDSHEITKRAAHHPYGCKDRVFQDGYWLQVRLYRQHGNYDMVNQYIKHTMSKECRYDKSLTDPRCETCKHAGLGEKYDNLIRNNGS